MHPDSCNEAVITWCSLGVQGWMWQWAWRWSLPAQVKHASLAHCGLYGNTVNAKNPPTEMTVIGFSEPPSLWLHMDILERGPPLIEVSQSKSV